VLSCRHLRNDHRLRPGRGETVRPARLETCHERHHEVAKHLEEGVETALQAPRDLSKYERRAEASLRIERMGERQGVALWRVADLAGGRGRESVGFEGLVGQSGPFGERSASAGSRVQGGGAHGAEERREGGSQRRPAGNDPRNPPTPRGVAANPPNEAAEVWPDGAWGEL